MALSELGPRTNDLNVAAGFLENGAKIATVATVAAILIHRAPWSIILRGAVVAVGLKALSSVCDLAVDTINDNSRLN
jgi:hypothetical protein